MSIDELYILSTANQQPYDRHGKSIYNIIKIGIQAGTIKNILAEIKSYLEREDKSFVLKMKRPELYTDKNIKIFGSIENIEDFGQEILENEEYLKNYKYIKEHYGQLNFSIIKIIIMIVIIMRNLKIFQKILQKKNYRFYNFISSTNKHCYV